MWVIHENGKHNYDFKGNFLSYLGSFTEFVSCFELLFYDHQTTPGNGSRNKIQDRNEFSLVDITPWRSFFAHPFLLLRNHQGCGKSWHGRNMNWHCPD